MSDLKLNGGGAHLELVEFEEAPAGVAREDPWWVKAALLAALLGVSLCTLVGALTILDWFWGRP